MRLLRWLFFPLLASLSATAACDAVPKDPEHTTEVVLDRGEMQVGFVGDEPARLQPIMQEAAARVADRHDVRMVSVTGSEAKLLRDLEEGRLDLVVGGFHRSTPWSKNVALSAFYPEEPPKEELGVRAATRLGENRWLISVERALADDHADKEGQE